MVFLGLLLTFFLTPGCTQEQTTPDSGGECQTHNDCWKKACPQTNKVDYDLCIKEKLNDKDGPKYQLCTDKNQCTEPTEDTRKTYAGGQVNVQLKVLPPGLNYSFLSLYIFPSKDLDGKKIDCARLETATKEPTADNNLLDPTLGRYWGERTDTGPFLYPISNGMANLFPLIFSKDNVGVAPAGKGYVVVVQAFCNSDERPNKTTKPRHSACIDGVELKSGFEVKPGEYVNNVNIELPIKPGESCF
jgi:hypothetical protein